MFPASRSVFIDANDQDMVFTDEFPDIPTGYAVTVSVMINSGVILNASTATVPALSFVGLHADSVVMLSNLGSVRGAGGQGGTGGFKGSGPTWWYYGGGGGGAGSVVGPGGLVQPGGGGQTEGDPGTVTTGGAGGTSWSTVAPFALPDNYPDDAEDGGTAILTPCMMHVWNGSGEIHGGGGGGTGGYGILGGANGGNLGLIGNDNAPLTPGAAGYAIDHTGPAPIIYTGSSTPQLLGPVG